MHGRGLHGGAKVKAGGGAVIVGDILIKVFGGGFSRGYRLWGPDQGGLCLSTRIHRGGAAPVPWHCCDKLV